MRVDAKATIGGVPIKAIRDFLRKVWESFHLEHLKSALHLDSSQAERLVGAMLSEGLVAWSADRKDLLTVTALGSRLAAASFTKPIPRAKADRLVADLLQRAKEINSRTDLLLWVDEIRCFGSYITDSPDVGDIDLVVSLRRRIEDGTEFVKRTLERAEQSGKRFSNYAAMLSYSDHEVLLLLKNRVSYLSFHPMSDLETLKFETRIVFRRKPLWLSEP